MTSIPRIMFITCQFKIPEPLIGNKRFDQLGFHSWLYEPFRITYPVRVIAILFCPSWTPHSYIRTFYRASWIYCILSTLATLTKPVSKIFQGSFPAFFWASVLWYCTVWGLCKCIYYSHATETNIGVAFPIQCLELQTRVRNTSIKPKYFIRMHWRNV